MIFGLLTFCIPQILGTAMARYWLDMSWTASVLLASMFASHTLLAYPVASRLGIARHEAVAVTIGATIITDTLALLVLAVIADSAKGVELNLLFFAVLAAGMAVFTVLAWWGIPFIARWFFRNTGENGSAQFVFVLAVVCVFSYFSHYAQMEPIIGAFLAGLAFTG